MVLALIECTMGLQGSRNSNFGQFTKFQHCVPLFWLRQSGSSMQTAGADYVESCWGSIRMIPANMSAQWASRGPKMMILASLPDSSHVGQFFGSDKVVLAYRLLGLTMLSAQWATRGPEMMILAFLSKKWVLKAGIGQTGQNHHFWTPGCQ